MEANNGILLGISAVLAIFITIWLLRRYTAKHPDENEKVKWWSLMIPVKTYKKMLAPSLWMMSCLFSMLGILLLFQPFRGYIRHINSLENVTTEPCYYFYYTHPITQAKVTMGSETYYFNLTGKDILLIPITSEIDDDKHYPRKLATNEWITCDTEIIEDIHSFEKSQKNGFTRYCYTEKNMLYMVVAPEVYEQQKSAYDSIRIRDGYIYNKRLYRFHHY